MHTPRTSAQEAKRLVALDSYHLLDSLPEQDYEDITQLAAQICQTPIALISLVDEQRQWFKARKGLALQQTPREHSFCAHNLTDPTGPLIVADARLDERFAHNPLVTGEPHIVFYAGVPLTDPQGNTLGSLCVIDEQVRQLTPDQVGALERLARQVMSLLKRRQTNQALGDAQGSSQRQQLDIDFALQAVDLGVWEVDPATNLVIWDDRCRALFGIAKDNPLPYEQAIRYIHLEDVERVDRAVGWAINPDSDGLYDQTYRTLGADDGRLRWVRFQGKAYFTGQGKLDRFAGIAQEVTQQVLAQQRLAASEARFRSLIQEAPVPTMLMVGSEHTIEVANPAMLAMLGRDASIVGQAATAAVPELAAQPYLQLLDGVFTSGTAYEAKAMPGQLVNNGVTTHHHFDFTYKPLRNEAGQVYGVLSMANDITHQVEAQRALAASQQHLTLLRDTVPAMIFYLDQYQRYQSYNQVFRNWFGVDETEVVGQSVREFVGELAYQKLAPHLAVAYGGQTERYEMLSPSRMGELRWLSIVYTPHLDEGGQVVGVIVHATDITHSKQVEQALQNAVDLAQLGIWEIDVASQVAQFSPLVTEWVGGQEPLTLAGAVAAIEPADRPAFQDAYAKAHDVTRGGLLEVKYHLTNQQTRQVYLLHSVGQMQFDAAGQPVTLSGFSRDITQLHAAQLALEHQVQERTGDLQLANEDLKRSNDNLQQFAYVASHDLQEPLRKIQSFSTLLIKQKSDQLDEMALDHLQRIVAAGSRMSTLIHDLLAYSRIATRQQAFGPVSLQAVLAGVLDTLEWRIEQTGAQVTVDELPVARGDESQLSQLFQNLVSNALKFVARGQAPRVHIQYAHRALSELPAQVRPTQQVPHYHQISVCDEGIGFDTKYRDRIFGVFQRLHGKSEYAGTGVGLAICQRVVENHGGAITAESKPGEGATFCVYLPA